MLSHLFNICSEAPEFAQGDYLLIIKHYKSPAKRCTAQDDDGRTDFSPPADCGSDLPRLRLVVDCKALLDSAAT